MGRGAHGGEGLFQANFGGVGSTWRSGAPCGLHHDSMAVGALLFQAE